MGKVEERERAHGRGFRGRHVSNAGRGARRRILEWLDDAVDLSGIDPTGDLLAST
jgi:hypothetical protein